MTDAQAPPPTEFAAETDLSLPQRIWGILTSPVTVLDSLRRRPRMLGALIILVLLGLVAGVLLMELSAEEQIRQLDHREGVTPEQREQAVKQAEIVKYMSPIGAVVGTLVYIVVLAAILLFLGNVLLGGQATYRQMLAGCAHLGMVSIPELAVKLPLMLSQGRLDVQTSLAALLPQDGDKGFLHFALAQLDIFGFWRLGLAVLVVAVMGGVPLKRAAVGVIGAWIIWSLIWIPAQTFLSGLQGS